MRIQWTETSTGGYMSQRFGGWWTGETDAMITPDGDEWHVALRLNGRHEYMTCKTATQAKRAAAQKLRKIREAIC